MAIRLNPPPSFRFFRLVLGATWALLFLLASDAGAQFDLNQPPIAYFKTAPADPVAKLGRRLQAGETKLRYEPETGYLKSLLAELAIPVSSQSLVFSKTSLQVKHISPRSPRAIYFNDDVYVGFVQGGDLEISAVDPRLAANFYLLSQHETDRPRLARQTFDCLQCHSSALTRDVPGHMIRSVAAGPDGHVRSGAESFLTDHSSPLKERWGGWYVTGKHGAERHLGNQFVRQADEFPRRDLDPGANVLDLSPWVDTSAYLSPHSDIVALMTLEHQANLHNRLARASFLARVALQDDAEGAQASTRDKLRDAATQVTDHLLFRDEIALAAPIEGSASFARDFAARGPFDGRGRSLRAFDLKLRLFKHPCSYLIYSEAFDEAPAPLRSEIYRQLAGVLVRGERADDFRHLSAADRRAIVEILRETKRNLPRDWPEADLRPAAP